jgi:dihydrofolate reductase
VTNWSQIDILVDAKAFVIGGADIYNSALSSAKYLYTTIVHAELEGDTYFPEWNKDDWQEVERDFRGKDENNKFDVENIQYKRID